MKIDIKRQQPEELEQFLIENEIEPASTRFGYDWNLKGDSITESIEDFHMFCISIVKDLITEEFKTDEEGKITYDINNVTKNNFNEEKFSYLFDDEEDEDEEDEEYEEYEEINEKEYLLDNLQYLFSTIAKRKIDNESSGR